MAKPIMESGKLVPDSLMIGMVEKHVASIKGNVLFDGFPRTVAQAKELEKVVPVDLVVAINVPHETIVSRLSNRWIHAASGRTYAYDYNPPKVHGLDDVTGEPLTQREDDKAEVVSARLRSYEELTKPLIDYYAQKKGVLSQFHGTESDVIYPQIKKYFLNETPFFGVCQTK